MSSSVHIILQRQLSLDIVSLSSWVTFDLTYHFSNLESDLKHERTLKEFLLTIQRQN